MGVDPSTLARWERGEREPAGPLAKAVNDFFDCATKSDDVVRVSVSAHASMVFVSKQTGSGAADDERMNIQTSSPTHVAFAATQIDELPEGALG